MKTIKYTVDRGFRRAGEVRSEEDAVADNLILRGFAEETDEQPDAGTGDASAVAQYHPEGVEADTQERGGTLPLPAALNAPGEVGSNVPSDAPSDAADDAATDAAVTNDAPSDAAGTAAPAAPVTRSRSTKTGPVASPVPGLGTVSEGETNPVTTSETANAAEVESGDGTDIAETQSKAETPSEGEAETKDESAEKGEDGQTGG